MPQTEKFGEVRALLDLAEKSEKGLDAVIQAHDAVTAGKARLAVTLIVVWMYAVGVGVVILYLVVRGLLTENDVSDDLIEVIKFGLLPIVMLVLGHYFGSSSAGK